LPNMSVTGKIKALNKVSVIEALNKVSVISTSKYLLSIIAYQNISYEFYIIATLPSTLIQWYAHECNILLGATRSEHIGISCWELCTDDLHNDRCWLLCVCMPCKG